MVMNDEDKDEKAARELAEARGTIETVAIARAGYVLDGDDEVHGPFILVRMQIAEEQWRGLLDAAELGMRLQRLIEGGRDELFKAGLDKVRADMASSEQRKS